jgi:hypothetical protein
VINVTVTVSIRSQILGSRFTGYHIFNHLNKEFEAGITNKTKKKKQQAEMEISVALKIHIKKLIGIGTDEIIKSQPSFMIYILRLQPTMQVNFQTMIQG